MRLDILALDILRSHPILSPTKSIYQHTWSNCLSGAERIRREVGQPRPARKPAHSNATSAGGEGGGEGREGRGERGEGRGEGEGRGGERGEGQGRDGWVDGEGIS